MHVAVRQMQVFKQITASIIATMAAPQAMSVGSSLSTATAQDLFRRDENLLREWTDQSTRGLAIERVAKTLDVLEQL